MVVHRTSVVLLITFIVKKHKLSERTALDKIMDEKLVVKQYEELQLSMAAIAKIHSVPVSRVRKILKKNNVVLRLGYVPNDAKRKQAALLCWEGIPISEICTTAKISRTTAYKWLKKEGVRD